MALRDWSRRRLIRLWFVGIAAEGILIAGSVYQARRTDAIDAARSQRKLGGGRPVSPTERAAALKQLAAQGVSVQTRNDTVVAVQLTPERQQQLDTALRSISGSLRKAAPALFAAFALIIAAYLAIPAALIVVTVLWLRATRRVIKIGAATTQ